MEKGVIGPGYMYLTTESIYDTETLNSAGF